MATISKTGIQDGLTSKAEHITRIIDALDGTATRNCCYWFIYWFIRWNLYRYSC